MTQGKGKGEEAERRRFSSLFLLLRLLRLRLAVFPCRRRPVTLSACRAPHLRACGVCHRAAAAFSPPAPGVSAHKAPLRGFVCAFPSSGLRRQEPPPARPPASDPAALHRRSAAAARRGSLASEFSLRLALSSPPSAPPRAKRRLSSPRDPETGAVDRPSRCSLAGQMGLPCLPASWCLLALLVAFPEPRRAEVVGKGEAGFGECGAFFYHRTPPEGFLLLEGQQQRQAGSQVAKICQKYKEEPRFATLYSTQDKIPLYSAFRYSEAARSSPEEETWLVEPQIDDPENGLAGMMPEAEVTGSVNNLGTNQALTADYADSGYERGQLNPSSLHKDDHQIATYTLTNAFPVMPPVQDVWHWEVENLVGQSLAPHCADGKDLYLLSGAIPSSLRMKDKVAVPKSLWMAACCDDGSAAWSVGFIKEAAAEDRLEDLSLEELEKKLSSGTQLFKDNCGQDRHDPKKLEVVLKSVKKIRAQKPVPQMKKSSPSHQTGTKKECGFLKKLFCFIVTPIFKLLKCVLYLIVQIVKYTFNFLCYLIQAFITGLCNYIKAIASVLMDVFASVIQVFVNILNGIAKNIYSVLMALYRIICVPVNVILDIVSFPFYVLGAVPAVLKDIVSGIGGLLLLVIDAITNIVKGLNYIVSHLAKRFLPKISSDL